MHMFMLGSSYSHIGMIHLQKINRLPVSEREESHIGTTVFKDWDMIVTSYINVFKPSYNRCNTRLQMALNILLHKTSKGQQLHLFLDQKYGLK